MKQNSKIKGRLRNYLYLPLYFTLFLLPINILVYFQDRRAGAILTGFVIIYFTYVFISHIRNGPVLEKEMMHYVTQYATVQNQLLDDFKVPYALLDQDGKILWVNKQFEKITGKEKGYQKTIFSIFPMISKESIQNKQEDMSFLIRWEDKMFRGEINRITLNSQNPENDIVDIKENEQNLISFYLFDETKLNQYIKAYHEERLVAALVYIDNYEEALDSIEDVKRSLLSALIDRKVNEYFSKVDALVRKTEKDKYFVVFKYKYLNKLEKDKFSLLEDVKNVRVGNEMSVTLSIGIGIHGDNYNKNYEYARMSIDLALGRGGDQTVVRKDEEIFYYGGKSKTVEKNTRVKARIKAHALRETLQSRENVIIMGHNISDVDSFGAAIGIYCAAKVLNKKAQIVLNEVTSSLRPLKECFSPEKGYPEDLFINSERAMEIITRNTLVMVVDTNRPNYTECPQLLERGNAIVIFDHHRQSNEVIQNPILSYIEPYASSTCEMIAEVLQYFQEKIKLEASEADCIYAGILIDTNNFMTKTGVRTFEAAAYLRRCGTEVTRVRKLLRNDMSSYKARAEVVRHAEVYKGAFAISVCPGKMESPTIVGAQAADELLNIIGIKASFVLTEYQGKIYISSRSIDEINVQLIMERLGGGGHLNVAGAQMTNCTLGEAKRSLQNTIEEMIEEGEIEI